MSEPAIRRATSDDFPAIVQMIRDLAAHIGTGFVPKVSVETLERDGPLGNDRFRILVAEIDGTILGFSLYSFIFSGWRGMCGLFVEDLYVDPSARGSGLGKKLLAAAAKLERANAGFIKLEVKLSDKAAVRFYEKLGMTVFEGEGLMLLDINETKALAGS
jgi:ribosomal protein S18 acetylase RimI-like enzyme